LKGIVDRARTDKPVKYARDGYVTEHMEMACYQILERLAERAGGRETAEVARHNRADEEVRYERDTCSFRGAFSGLVPGIL
jgi:ferritin-like metal-binding protein YciE